MKKITQLSIHQNNKNSFHFANLTWIKDKLNQRNTKGQKIFQDLESYVFGNQFNSKIKCEQILIRYNFLIVHTWLIQQALNKNLLKNYLIKQQLESILYKSATNYVYQFDDNFNQEIKLELERNQNVLKFVLDDYFVFNFQNKPLHQIVQEDVLLNQENDTQNIETISKYIQNNYEHILKINQDDLRNGKIEWLK